MTREIARTALLVAVLLGAVVTAGFMTGDAAGSGALVGAGLVLGVLGLGSLSVSVIARLMPAASLLFALLTYTLQLVALLAVFVALERSGSLGETLDREWLGGTLIVGTIGWMVVQLTVATRARIPAFDVPDEGR